MPRLFGSKLRYLRDSYSIIQAELAAQLGVSGAFINNIEAGRKGPSLTLVLQVAKLFGVATDYLLRDDVPINSMPPSSTRPLASRASGLPSSPQRFGQKLRYLRKNRGMTQMSLVAQLGLRSQSHISLMEVGRNEPSIDMVVQLADLFGVTTDYLLWDTIPIKMRSGQRDPEAS
jgi:transcriptional regulator with XRE-family HTH domain